MFEIIYIIIQYVLYYTMCDVWGAFILGQLVLFFCSFILYIDCIS